MRYENKKYLQWIRQQPCSNCKKPGPNHAHHIKGVGYLSGGSLKAPDWATMPLCKGENDCHGKVHRPDRYPEMNEMQWEWLARTLGRAIEQGIL